MGILDRYLLRQFLRVFVVCFCSLTGLFVVFDAFSNLDDFLGYASKYGDVLTVLLEYYGYRSIALFDRMSGVLALTAAMFTLTWFQRFNELTAISAAGIPHRRIIAPIVWAAVGISLLAAASRELVIPLVRDQLGRNAKDLAGDLAQEMRPRFDNQTEVLIRGYRTYANELRINKPDLLLPEDLSAYGRKLAAEDAYYLAPRKGLVAEGSTSRLASAPRPGGYLLRQVSLPKNLAERTSLARNGQTILYFPGDTPWLEPDECFVASDVDFEQLTGGYTFRNFSSTATLIRGLHNRGLDFGADVRVTIHSRMVQPLLDVALLFLGLPLVMTQAGRNVFLSIAQCVVVVTAFMLVVFGSRYLGGVYLLDPALSAWLPLMIFVPAGVYISEPLLA
jgi:lipopolysaccharide export system permease protein